MCKEIKDDKDNCIMVSEKYGDKEGERQDLNDKGPCEPY